MIEVDFPFIIRLLLLNLPRAFRLRSSRTMIVVLRCVCVCYTGKIHTSKKCALGSITDRGRRMLVVVLLQKGQFRLDARTTTATLPPPSN